MDRVIPHWIEWWTRQPEGMVNEKYVNQVINSHSPPKYSDSAKMVDFWDFPSWKSPFSATAQRDSLTLTLLRVALVVLKHTLVVYGGKDAVHYFYFNTNTTEGQKKNCWNCCARNSTQLNESHQGLFPARPFRQRASGTFLSLPLPLLSTTTSCRTTNSIWFTNRKLLNKWMKFHDRGACPAFNQIPLLLMINGRPFIHTNF